MSRMPRVPAAFQQRLMEIHQAEANEAISTTVIGSQNYIAETVAMKDKFTALKADVDLREKQLEKEMATLKSRRTDLLRCAWKTSIVMPSTDEAYVLMLSMNSLVDSAKAVKPNIIVNGVRCGYSESTKHTKKDGLTVNVQVASLLANDPPNLHVAVEGNTDFPGVTDVGITMPNPYLIRKEWLNPENCLWQCEGHSDEKVIMYYVPEGERWNIGTFQLVMGKFDLLASGKLLGTFQGHYLVNNCLYIPIPNVTKAECAGKRMELRLNHAKGVKVLLPPPIVMTVNREIV